MSVLLDLIGSVVIASFVILMGLSLNATISGTADASMANLNVQESMADIVRTLEYDFRKIGYEVPDPKACIKLADTSHLVFYANMDRTGGIDSVEWFLGPPLTTLPNPKVRVLYRKLNDEPAGGAAGLGVTEFKLRYFTQQGVEIMPLNASMYSQIWIIEVSLRVESPYKVQDVVTKEISDYAAAYWRQTRLSSRNIKRHG
ncbi:MAG: hypothetical protein AB1428_03085 [Bacteroidota bacterium]